MRKSFTAKTLNEGSVSLPISFSQVFTVAGLVTDGLGNSLLQGNWVKANTTAVTYQVVSENTSFSGGNVQAIVLGI